MTIIQSLSLRGQKQVEINCIDIPGVAQEWPRGDVKSRGSSGARQKVGAVQRGCKKLGAAQGQVKGRSGTM